MPSNSGDDRYNRPAADWNENHNGSFPSFRSAPLNCASGSLRTVAAFVVPESSQLRVFTAKAFTWTVAYEQPAGHVANTTSDGVMTHVVETYVDSTGWVHLAASYDGTTKCLYVDGVVWACATAVVATDASPFVIGAPWVGLVDDFRIYNRALTGDEVFAVAAQ